MSPALHNKDQFHSSLVIKTVNYCGSTFSKEEKQKENRMEKQFAFPFFQFESQMWFF